MKALTLWQPWASLIMVGAKPIEWRRWPLPRYVTGCTIVIHAGARPMRRAEVQDLVDAIRDDEKAQSFGGFGSTGLVADKALELLLPVLEFGQTLPHSAGLGTVRMLSPHRATDILSGHTDSDRIDEAAWGWPVDEVQPFVEPVSIGGHQGFWNWPDAAELAAMA